MELEDTDLQYLIILSIFFVLAWCVESTQNKTRTFRKTGLHLLVHVTCSVLNNNTCYTCVYFGNQYIFMQAVKTQDHWLWLSFDVPSLLRLLYNPCGLKASINASSKHSAKCSDCKTKPEIAQISAQIFVLSQNLWELDFGDIALSFHLR